MYRYLLCKYYLALHLYIYSSIAILEIRRLQLYPEYNLILHPGVFIFSDYASVPMPALNCWHYTNMGPISCTPCPASEIKKPSLPFGVLESEHKGYVIFEILVKKEHFYEDKSSGRL